VVEGQRMTCPPFDPLLSVFPSATDPATVADLPLSAIIDRMRGPELAEATARIHSAFAAAGGGDAGKRATAADKRRLPGVTLAGAFDRRANAAWREPAGLVQIDLDNLAPAELAEARALLTACPWVACLWASPSGAGLKGAVRVPGLLLPEPSSYTSAWRAVSRWLASVGLVNDPAAKDAARLAFLAHDPEALHNPEAVPFPLDDWAEPEPAPSIPLHHGPARAVRMADAERRAMGYVQAMPPSVEGSNGSAGLVAAVRALRDGFDLSGAGLWRCLEGWNAARATPPWSRAELEHALTSVESVPPQRGRGWLLHAEPARAEVRTPDPWPAPTPILATSDPPPFDLLGMIPRNLSDLHDFIDAGAEALQVPVELIAGAAVGLAALACSRAVEVELAPGWREPAPLWVLPLLRPGERKSASLGMLAAPFHAWATAERKHLAEPLARYAERRRTMEARLGAVRNHAAKEAAPDKRAKSEAEASDLAAELDAMPARLAAPDLLVQSFTPEGLRDLLEANGERVGIVSAEADAAELMGARYSDAGPSIDLLLCAHAGDPITTRRAGGRVVALDRPAVGMVLAVQPEAVRAVLADRAAKGRGLIDRMLLILPPSRMGSRLLDPAPMPRDLSAWWACSIGRLLDLPWPGRCIVGHDAEPTRCTSPPRILGIDAEARRLLWDLRGTLEPRLAEGADLAPVSGFASKLPGACARLALAFAMLRDPGAEVVDGESMRAACAWAPFLLAHHRAVLGDAAEPPEAHHARRLWRALQRRGRASMTARELFALVRDSAVPTMADFRPVLDLLCEHDAVRPAPGEAGNRGRPAELWEVNPALVPCDLCDKSEGMEGAA
jgi:hypothetical protein